MYTSPLLVFMSNYLGQTIGMEERENETSIGQRAWVD